MGESSSRDQSCWKRLWGLKIPPRIKMFLWRICVDSLPTNLNLSRRLSSIDYRCDACGDLVESDIHIFVYCPMAEEIWLRSGMEVLYLKGDYSSMAHLVEVLMGSSEDDRLGNYAVVLWAIWNCRNKQRYDRLEGGWQSAGLRAVQFVDEFRGVVLHEEGGGQAGNLVQVGNLPCQGYGS
ncbi:hypothetical protein RDABS01_024339 [Bienertia sinuspersici]